ncbi:hypothetical protein [Ectopseudomonas mendocina]|uniref:hypothetical protein n=1 Tax=Ectopseudomonas mendocina TaxID=300 RepID=UPI0011C04CC5|nr:hypothetical protein [Pseudomonas mendocina]
MMNYTFIADNQVVVCTKHRIKVVPFEVASQVFEVTKLYILKRINKALYTKCVNDLLGLGE